MSVTRTSKMLRYARMAAMRELRRGIGYIGQRRIWAETPHGEDPDISTVPGVFTLR